MDNVKEDVRFAGQLTLCADSLKMTIQIFADMIDNNGKHRKCPEAVYFWPVIHILWLSRKGVWGT